MATDIKQRVNQEIARLEKDIVRQRSDLAALRADLKTHKGIYRLLSGDTVPQRCTPARQAKKATAKPVDWDSVLKNLPRTFITDALARRKASRGMSRRQLAMAVTRWVKDGKIKRMAPGKYRKG